MTINRWTMLLAATAMTTFAGTSAIAAPAAHHHPARKARPAASDASVIRAQLAEQRAQIEALTAQVAALTAAAAPAAAPAAPVNEEAEASTEFLKAQVGALQTQIESLNTQVTQAAPTWSGAPQLKGSGGFSFKPSGELQYDAGYVSNPGNRIPGSNLGFNDRSRRLLIGAAGDLPGDFKYTFQFNFAQGLVDYEDLVLSYEPKGKPYTVTIGYFYPYNTLENMTSNRFTSFIERSQMTDAFGEGRRLGIGLGYVAGDLRFNAGAFGNSINGGTGIAPTFDNNDYELSARLLYAPLALGGQLHFAVAGQYRHFKTSSFGIQYRARPFSQTTDQRFENDVGVAGKSDYILGVEALGIFGPFHAAGEAQYVKVQGIRPGAALNPGEIVSGTRLASDPGFFSAYGEVGFWLTGETRGYRGGKVDRTKILNGFDKGGWGGFQLVGRIDYLDLKDRVGGPNVGTQVIDGILNGGQQTGYLAAINWWPIDYVRFTAQYTHAVVEGGPNAALVKPLSTAPLYNRTYSSDIALVRAQIDF
ncbi:OprO/OprP family phosphate-selective porin [Glacieibacterium sp.]|uniref:OprO/OprP family phosphate-selective porin n=1 Tax=Glacieibacterium sp. TaxID=2860237 RepID=UPI003B005BB0